MLAAIVPNLDRPFPLRLAEVEGLVEQPKLPRTRSVSDTSAMIPSDAGPVHRAVLRFPGVKIIPEPKMSAACLLKRA
jgi:hypothetical protein